MTQKNNNAKIIKKGCKTHGQLYIGYLPLNIVSAMQYVSYTQFIPLKRAEFLFPSYLLQNNFLVRSITLCSLPLSQCCNLSGFNLSWSYVCFHSLYEFIDVSSLLFTEGTISSSHLLPLALLIFLCPFPHKPMSLEGSTLKNKSHV